MSNSAKPHSDQPQPNSAHSNTARTKAPLYLALDQGGHSSRAIVVDASGQIIAEAREPISTFRQAGYRVEHDARELGNSLKLCCQAVGNILGEDAARIQSAGMATQRSSIVCWEKSSGHPLTPVISWQDRRASEFVESLSSQSEQIRQITGLVLSPHYGASKLRWCLENDQQVVQAQKKNNLVIGPLASFLTRQITAETPDVCDPANASRTQLWDRWSRDWSDELCETYGVEKSLLPSSVSTKYDYGKIQVGKYAIPLALVTGDQSAAIYAFGEPQRDIVYINMGTGAFIQRPIGQAPLDVDGLLNSVVYQDGIDASPEYVLEGTVNGAGSALSWFANQLGQDSKALVSQGLQEVKMAESESPPIFLNGISGLGSPFWDGDFESKFLSESSDGLKAVAILESIAFLIHANIERMNLPGNSIKKIVLTGGLSSVDYLCQAIADVCEIEVRRSPAEEATAMGVIWLLSDNSLSENQFISVSQGMTEYKKEEAASIRLRHALWKKEMLGRLTLS